MAGELLKPPKEHVTCGCGCGRKGLPRMKGGKPKKWKDGKVHTRNCDKNKCRACRGSSIKGRANRRELRFAKSIKGRRVALSGARGGGADVTVELRTCRMYFEETEQFDYIRVPSKWAPLADLPSVLGATPRVWRDDVIALVPIDDLIVMINHAKEDSPGKVASYSVMSDDLSVIRKWWSGEKVQAKFAEVSTRADRSGGPAALALSWGEGEGSDVKLAVMRRSDLDHLTQLAELDCIES